MHSLKQWILRPILRQFARRARPYVRSYGLLRTVKYKRALVGEPAGERVLVLAPHMDDEVIGCGGVLVKHVRAGAAVTVVYVTDGRYGSKALSHDSGAKRQQHEAELVATRRHEAEQALQSLGIAEGGRGIFMDAPETELDRQADLVKRLRELLCELRPDLVYLPFFLEEHPDHQAMTPLLLQAAIGTDLAFDCCAYEVWTPLIPNYLVDISDVVERKRAALACYQSQLADTDYIHTALGLNAYRSSALLESGGFVEAFWLASRRDYEALYRCTVDIPATAVTATPKAEPQGGCVKQAANISAEASATSKNVSAAFMLRLAQYPLLALYVLLVPRTLGPNSYGQFALLLSVFSIFASLVDLGLSEIAGRFVPEAEVARDAQWVRRFATNMLALKVAVGGVAAIVFYAVLQVLYSDLFPPVYFVVTVAIMLVSSVSGVFYALLFGQNRLGPYGAREPLRRMLNLVFVLAFFYFFGLLGAVMGNLAMELALALLGFIWTRRQFRADEFRINLPFLKPYLAFGLMFYVSSALQNVWQKLGNILIGFWAKDARQIAIFDMPNQILSVTMNMTLFAVAAFIPVFTKLLLTGKEEKVIRWATLIVRYTGAVCVLVAGGFALASEPLLPIVIGPGFEDAYANGVVLLLSLIPLLYAQLGFVFSVVYKQPGKYLQALVTAIVTFLITSAVLIPLYGALGCSVASLLSSIVFAAVIHLHYRHKLAGCLKAFAHVVVFGAVCLPFMSLRSGLVADLLLAVAFTGGYTLLLLISRTVGTREVRDMIRAIAHRPDVVES